MSNSTLQSATAIGPYTTGTDIDGKPYVSGVGLPGDCGGTLYPETRFNTIEDCATAALIANRAFLEGKHAARREICSALGIADGARNNFPLY